MEERVIDKNGEITMRGKQVMVQKSHGATNQFDLGIVSSSTAFDILVASNKLKGDDGTKDEDIVEDI